MNTQSVLVSLRQRNSFPGLRTSPTGAPTPGLFVEREMIEIFYKWFPAMLAVIGAASLAVKAVAPLTKTKVDDKLLGLLSKLHSILSKLALNPK